ncbi:MAG: NAD(P)H-hydrate epimerase [Phycisphaerae bacterium]|nr:NAD(P)H-hydrate epimerase [Phycisphaerae bacterium]
MGNHQDDLHGRHENHERTPAPANDGPAALAILDREAARLLDEAAITEYGIPGIVLMENAARALLHAVHEMLRGDLADGHVVVCCGSGNNGGDGYALARHLANAGTRCSIISIGRPRESSDAATNRLTCERMDMTIITPTDRERLENIDLVVDAMYGTGLDRPLDGISLEMVQWINDLEVPVLCVDIPSGMDADSGELLPVAVRGDCTVTFVAMKPSMLTLTGQRHTGDVIVGQIGSPPCLLDRLARSVPLGRIPHDDQAGP